MATLTDDQAHQLCGLMEKWNRAVNYRVPQAKLALQAIEDFFELPETKSALSTAIDTATSPFTFTAAQKKALIAAFFLQKARREGVVEI